jgi:hypothetical protein
MVHWSHLPVAFAPTPGGPDAGGCFSGTAAVDGNQVAMLSIPVWYLSVKAKLRFETLFTALGNLNAWPSVALAREFGISRDTLRYIGMFRSKAPGWEARK